MKKTNNKCFVVFLSAMLVFLLSVMVMAAGDNAADKLIFIACTDGTASKLDKDGELVSLNQYVAFIDGNTVNGFVSKDTVAAGFYKNEYDNDNGWYLLSGNRYDDSQGNIKVAEAEMLTKAMIYSDKYITVGNNIDVELTATTKYASAIDEVAIGSLAELKSYLNDSDPTDTYAPSVLVYVVYDADTGAALYVYITGGDRTVNSIALSTKPSKTEYEMGEELDVSGGKITVSFSGNQSETIDLTANMVTGFDSTVAGKQVLTVSWLGATTTFEVNIKDDPGFFDAASLIFIAAADGAASKLDKDGKLTSLVQYIAFIDGVAVEGFVSEDSVGVGFYENEYDAENGWYILTGNSYDDSEKDIKVTGRESLTKATIYSDKYITVDGSVDVELTSATKYASAIDETPIGSLAELKAELNDNDPTDSCEPTATIYVVYNNETGVALYVYLTSIVNEYCEAEPETVLTATSNIVNDHIVLFVKSSEEISTQILHIALYSEAGQMLDYIIVPTIEPFTTTNVVFNDDAAVKTAKVFLWDSLSATTPIAEAVEVTIR